ncbi:hypothetical protein ABEY63_25510 [Priestia aryabhattai]|uniref:hypothetical protein n=1 Tax=Priestia aryabhattai TaxID=412384 RepID=UPI003D2C287B
MNEGIKKSVFDYVCTLFSFLLGYGILYVLYSFTGQKLMDITGLGRDEIQTLLLLIMGIPYTAALYVLRRNKPMNCYVFKWDGPWFYGWFVGLALLVFMLD